MKTTLDIDIEVMNLLADLPEGAFIAGGSVTSDYFVDIDVFFPSNESYLTAVSHLTHYNNYHHINSSIFAENFVTAISNPVRIQLVNKQFMSVRDTLRTFDLNKSKIAVTKAEGVVQDPSYSLPLHVDYNNVRTSTPMRLLKYHLDKDFPLSDTELTKLIDYLGSAPNELMDPEYNDEAMVPRHEVLASFLATLSSYHCGATSLIYAKKHYPEYFI